MGGGGRFRAEEDPEGRLAAACGIALGADEPGS